VLCSYLNEAIQRLVNAGGETGWWGSWAKVVFNVARSNPYITLPPQYARIINMDVCRFPIRIQNEFYEELEAGIGLQSPSGGWNCNGAQEAYERGLWPTDIDLPSTNQLLRVYFTDPRDTNVQIVFNDAKDQNGNAIYGQNGVSTVNGFILTTIAPFVTSGFIVSAFGALTKPQTFGDIVLKAVDATTGDETFLARYTADETTPMYRRYYLNKLPTTCCTGDPATTTAQVTAMCKYEFVPVSRSTDLLLIGNIPALKAECESIRYAEMDNSGALMMSEQKHQNALRLLRQELDHYMGKDHPAINVAPFGTADLRRREIGTMI